MRRALLLLPLLALTVQPGCAYKVGSGLMDGVLESAAGQTQRGTGVTNLADDFAERALLAKLGHQLGEGLNEGALDVSEEQQARLEAVIDSLLNVATSKAGQGIRRDVSPELRAMVKQDIVQALAEGMRNEVGDSLEQTVDRVVTRAVLALRMGIEDKKLQVAMADLLRESIDQAMLEGVEGVDAEGNPFKRPAIKDTIRQTVEQAVLDPTTSDFQDLALKIADRVDESARRTENTLKAIISALVIILGVVALAYFLNQRALRRAKAVEAESGAKLRSLEGAMAVLDDDTRAALKDQLHIEEEDDE